MKPETNLQLKLDEDEARISDLFRELGWTPGLAESCTGGLLATRITQVAGSSEYFLGCGVCDSNASKGSLFGVENQLLEAHGAVSREVALALARGARLVFSSDLGLSITGIAGPGGGRPDKPVRTVFFGLVSPLVTYLEQALIPGDRDEIRAASVARALELIRLCFEGRLESVGVSP